MNTDLITGTTSTQVLPSPVMMTSSVLVISLTQTHIPAMPSRTTPPLPTPAPHTPDATLPEAQPSMFIIVTSTPSNLQPESEANNLTLTLGVTVAALATTAIAVVLVVVVIIGMKASRGDTRDRAHNEYTEKHGLHIASNDMMADIGISTEKHDPASAQEMELTQNNAYVLIPMGANQSYGGTVPSVDPDQLYSTVKEERQQKCMELTQNQAYVATITSLVPNECYSSVDPDHLYASVK